MSRMKFGRVKLSQEHDIPEDTIAGNMGLEVEEVEKAFGLRPTMSISTMTRPCLTCRKQTEQTLEPYSPGVMQWWC
jgi:hypothetical protein